MSETLLRDHSLYMVGDLRPAQLARDPQRAKTLAEQLIKEPAYSDPKHRGHEQLHRDVRALYEAAFPEGDEAELPMDWQLQANLRAAGGSLGG